MAEEILQEINGRTIATGELVPGFTSLKADGSTACGCWIYSGVFPKPGENRANERASRDFHGHGWGFAWPSDRRVLYNRASALSGWKAVERTEEINLVGRGKTKNLDGQRRARFCGNQASRLSTPPDGAVGDAALAGDKPFILHADGFGWIWVPVGLNDGPLPAHYEPLIRVSRSESHVPGAPCRIRSHKERHVPGQREYATSPDQKVSIRFDDLSAFTEQSYRAGGMSRTLSHLAELQPEMFL